jgi:hypothetical protein
MKLTLTRAFQHPIKLSMWNDFQILYLPDIEKLNKDQDVEEIKNLVARLYVALNIDENEKTKEDIILKEIEALKTELEPLEKVKPNG